MFRSPRPLRSSAQPRDAPPWLLLHPSTLFASSSIITIIYLSIIIIEMYHHHRPSSTFAASSAASFLILSDWSSAAVRILNASFLVKFAWNWKMSQIDRNLLTDLTIAASLRESRASLKRHCNTALVWKIIRHYEYLIPLHLKISNPPKKNFKKYIYINK